MRPSLAPLCEWAGTVAQGQGVPGPPASQGLLRGAPEDDRAFAGSAAGRFVLTVKASLHTVPLALSR